jgi:hypothetical protein
MDLQERTAFARQIQPKVRSKSDKFSWRLYLRAMKKGRERIYIGAWDNLFGQPHVPSLEGLKAGNRMDMRLLYIGYMHDDKKYFSGQPIREVARHGKAHCDYSYGPGFNTAHWLDVTDWFWSAYIERGRCAVWHDQVHEWVPINRNARKCAYCGKHEHRTVVTKKIVERVECWSSQPSTTIAASGPIPVPLPGRTHEVSFARLCGIIHGRRGRSG